MIKFADVINRLQKFIKNNKEAQTNPPHPRTIGFEDNGQVTVTYSDTTVVTVPTLGRAALMIHQRLDELEA